jgi:drug/metabolite transporter (DMT)-like permease
MTVAAPPAASRVTGLVNVPALLAVIIWGIVSPLAKWAFGVFPALTYSAFSAIVATVFFFLILLARRVPLGLENRADLRRLAIAGGLGMSLTGICFSAGLDRTSVAHAVILITAAPLFVAGARMAHRRTAPDGRTAIGLLVGFAGVVAVVGFGSSDQGATLSGDLLALGAGVASAAYSAVPAPLVPKYGPLKVSAWMSLFSLALAIPFGLGGLDDVIADVPSPLAWSTIVYVALIGSVVGNVLWFRGMQRHGVTKTVVYIYLEPVVAIAIAAAYLGEAIGPIQALGGLLAILGVALVRHD